MPFWALIQYAFLPATSSGMGMYELADVFRQELDIPIPDRPHTAYVPNRELVHQLAIHHRKADGERCDFDYHADDEMSDLPSPPTLDYGTDTTDATVHEERRGVSETPDAARSDISPFSYYYYPDPEYKPGPAARWPISGTFKMVLDLIEHIPLTKAESWVKCKNWRFQVAKANGIDGPLQDQDGKSCNENSPKFSIFQILHDQPVDAIDKMKAVSDWQATTGRSSFGSIPPPPASLISYLARRRNSTISISRGPGLDPEVDSAIQGPEINHTSQLAVLNALPVIVDVEEPGSDHISLIMPLADSSPIDPRTDQLAVSNTPLLGMEAEKPSTDHMSLVMPFADSVPTLLGHVDAQEYEDEMADPVQEAAMPREESQHDELMDAVLPIGHHTAETTALLTALQEFSIPNVRHVLEYRVSIAVPHKAVIKDIEYTPQRIRAMISILTAPSADVKRLMGFWEDQK